MTLGCGTWGGAITEDNITPLHLINRKHLAWETAAVATDTGSQDSFSRRGNYSRFDELERLRPKTKGTKVDIPTQPADQDVLDEVGRIAREFARKLEA